MREMYKRVKDPEAAQKEDPDVLKIMAETVAAFTKQTGFTDRELIFPAIDEFAQPVLHIALGTVNEVEAHNMKFIFDNFEEDIPSVKAQQIELDALVEELSLLTAIEMQYVAEHGDRYKEVKAGIVQYEKLLANKKYNDLLATESALAEQSKTLAAGMAKALAALKERHEELKAYDPAAAGREKLNEFVRTYESDLKDSTLYNLELSKRVDALHKEITAEREKLQNREAQREYEGDLAGVKIAKQRSFTLQLVGSGCRLFLEHYEAIMAKFEAMLLRRRLENEDIGKRVSEEDVRSFVKHQTELLALLSVVAVVMKSNNTQTEETITYFTKAAIRFGVLYREYYNKLASPKVHILESHVPLILARYKCLGLFSEEVGEREHQIVAKYHSILCNVPSFHKRVRLMLQRRTMERCPERKRDNSAATTLKGEEKAAKKQKLKSETIKEVVAKFIPI
jgi:hypothetical protein